jgi:hypothetical protein
MAYLAFACRSTTGLVFVVSAFSKLRSRAAFREFTSWLAGLRVPVVRSLPSAVAATMVAVEVAVVVLVGLPWTAWAGLLLAAAALAVFAAGTLLALRRGVHAPCQCFSASAAPLGLRHAARDVVLCVVAVVGAAGAAAGGARPPGAALALGAGAAAALFVVFLDDLAALISEPTGTGAAPVPGDNR